MTTATSEQKQRTESLYFRSSPRLRANAERYAEERGFTLSSGLSWLVERGLEAESDAPSVVALEKKVQKLAHDLAVLQERDRNWRAMFDSLQGQLRTVRVGQCPACRKTVTAFDQFLARRCPWPKCDNRLQQVMPLPQPEEFPPALAGLVGALGGFLFGVAASQGSA